MFDKIKRFYELGLWSTEQVYKAVEKGLITETQYNEIIK